MTHLTAEDIEAYVQGNPPRDMASFRRHVSSCDRCARRLEREARLEVTLRDAALEPVAAEPMARLRFARRAQGQALLTAAALLVVAGAWIVGSLNRREPEGARVPARAPAGEPVSWSVVAPPGALVRDDQAPGYESIEGSMPAYEVVLPDDYCRDVDVPLEESSGF